MAPNSWHQGWAGRSSQGGTPWPRLTSCPKLLTDAAVGTRKARGALAAEPVDTIYADATVVAAGRGWASAGPYGGPRHPELSQPPGSHSLTRAGGCSRWCLRLRGERKVSRGAPCPAPLCTRPGAPATPACPEGLGAGGAPGEDGWAVTKGPSLGYTLNWYCGWGEGHMSGNLGR